MTTNAQTVETKDVADFRASDKPAVAICNHDLDTRKGCDLPDCRYCAECGLGGHTNFIERVTNWIDEGQVIQEGLSIKGPDLIAQITRRISLRELARRTGFSPTYLSQVANAKVVISPGAFVKILTMEASLDQA